MALLTLNPQYYAESHGVIYVIDSTDEERLAESKEAFGEFLTRLSMAFGEECQQCSWTYLCHGLQSDSLPEVCTCSLHIIAVKGMDWCENMVENP